MFGQYLLNYRYKHNLTQAQMAEKVETSVGYYCLLEKGRKKPGFNIIRRLAKVLAVEESFIREML